MGKWMIVFAGLGLLGLLLYTSGSLTTEYLLLISGLMFITLIIDRFSSKIISLPEARETAEKFLKSEQVRGRIPSGPVRLLPESRLVNYILSDEKGDVLDPSHYNSLLEVDSGVRGVHAFNVVVSVIGNVIGITKLRTRKTVTEIEPSIVHVGTRPKRIEKAEERVRAEKEKIEEEAKVR